MKKFIYLLCLIVLGITSAGAQPGVPPGGLQLLQVSNNQGQNQPKLTTFDVDFHGGTPADLVAAIEKATGKPMNAIIPTEDADTQLPPLKMTSIVAPQLFNALETASHHIVAVQTGTFGGGFGGSYSQVQVGFGFKTSDSPISDNSIWNFYVDKPSLPPVVSTEPICRFYQLQSYLNRGFTVEDITTAIDTGWKMAGITSPPELNYHKETKLLIAFGRPEELATIKSVLDTLPESNASITEIEQLQKKVASLQDEVSQLDKIVSAKNSGK